jgi:coenzyme F420-reducing hydrogenase alpha subunit
MHGTNVPVDERRFEVAGLTRVEGEGSLRLVVRDGQVDEAQLAIFEAPRYFERLVVGRTPDEVLDIVARICGICPIAYQMSAVHAFEDLAGVAIEPAVRSLRRLLYCGEWIESHSLHIYLLHAPDFLGYDGAIEMAADHRDLVQRGLELKKIGNQLVELIGGRPIHPVNVRVGGFYRVPSERELAQFAPRLGHARQLAIDTVRWVAGFDFPDHVWPGELVSLRSPGEYPITGGRLVSTLGLDIGPEEFEDRVVEEHVAHSTALHARLVERGEYLLGPLARFALNAHELSPIAQDVAREVGLSPDERNPFRSIVVRAVEVLYACDEALTIIGRYRQPDRPAVDVPPRAGVGYGWTEAPRGMLWHRYETDADGTITSARIVPPTSQNQAAMERDLFNFVGRHMHLDDHELGHRAEQVIRSYDPCISCATHFLDLTVDRA